MNSLSRPSTITTSNVNENHDHTLNTLKKTTSSSSRPNSSSSNINNNSSSRPSSKQQQQNNSRASSPKNGKSFIPTTTVMQASKDIISKAHNTFTDRYYFLSSGKSEYREQKKKNSNDKTYINSNRMLESNSRSSSPLLPISKNVLNNIQNSDLSHQIQHVDNINTVINDNDDDNVGDDNNNNHHHDITNDDVLLQRSTSPFEQRHKYRGSRRRVLDIIECARKYIGGSEKFQKRRLSKIETRLLERLTLLCHHRYIFSLLYNLTNISI